MEQDKPSKQSRHIQRNSFKESTREKQYLLWINPSSFSRFGAAERRQVASTHVTFQYYFQVQVMILWAIQLSLTADLWGPPLALNRRLGSAPPDVLLQLCVPTLQLVNTAFQFKTNIQNYVSGQYI